MKHTFVIKGDPTPLAHCKYNNKRVYDTQAHAKNAFLISLGNLLEKVMPKKVPVKVTTNFYFPVSNRLSTQNAQKLYGTPHIIEPHVIDMGRFVLESINKRIYSCLGQVAHFDIHKFYGEEPQTIIKVETYDVQ